MANEDVMKKIESFSSILQKFGLQFIQSIGELKHSNEILVEKIRKIEKELLDLKSLELKLHEINSARDKMVKKITKIEKFMESVNSKLSESGGRLVNTPQGPPKKSHQTPKEVLNDLIDTIPKEDDVKSLRTLLNSAKEEIYVLTGGHMILFKLREEIRKLRPSTAIDNKLKDTLLEKVNSWKMQL